MLEMMMATRQIKPEAKGQFVNKSANTSPTITIPENVSFVNGVVIGAGGSGGGAGGGGGGGGSILYFNKLPVKKGDVFQLVVGAAAAYSFGDGNQGGVVELRLNGVAIATAVGGQGGKRTTKVGGAVGTMTLPSGSPLYNAGVQYRIGLGTTGQSQSSGAAGNAGSYDATTNTGGQSPYGKGGGEKIYGAGSKGGDPGDSSPTCAPGAIRLVWGSDREYPLNSLGNV